MQPWMKLAWADEGVKETAGPKATPAIVQYFKDVGRPDITSDEISWCAAFSGACLERSGIPLTLPPADRLLARSYLKVGTSIDTPRVGAIAVLWRGSPNSWQGHVGFVVGETATHVALLGGNQANSVNVAHFPKSQVLGYRWPAPALKPKETGSKIVDAAGQQQTDAGKVVGTQGLEQIIPAPPDQLPGVDTLAQHAGWLTGTLKGFEAFFLFSWGKLWWVAAALAVYWVLRILWNSGRIRWWRTDDANTGKTPIEPAAPEILEGEILDPLEEEAAHA